MTLSSLFVQPCTSVTCKHIYKFQDLAKEKFYKAFSEEVSLDNMEQYKDPDHIYQASEKKYVFFLKISKKDPRKDWKICKDKVIYMNMMRKRYLQFNALGADYDFFPKAVACAYNIKDPNECKNDFKLFSMVVLKKNYPLNKLVKKLDQSPIKNYMKDFRVRFRMYKAIVKKVIQMKQMNMMHCRLSIDNITLEIPKDFTDLDSSKPAELLETLNKSPLDKIDFTNIIKVKFLNPNFVAIGQTKCPDYDTFDKYFDYMTTKTEWSQKNSPSFGVWEISTAILLFESRFHQAAAVNYMDIDNQLNDKFKQLLNVNNTKNRFQEKAMNLKNPLDEHLDTFTATLRTIRESTEYPSQLLKTTINTLVLKNFQLDLIMQGKEVDYNLNNDFDSFNSNNENNSNYKMFMLILDNNLHVNIKKRISLDDFAKALDKMVFEEDKPVKVHAENKLLI